ncbi:hypothetical protein M8494_24645 [Serratia ureilytica]
MDISRQGNASQPNYSTVRLAKSDLRMNARSYQELLNSKQRLALFLSNDECRLFHIYVIVPFRDVPSLLCLYYASRYFVWRRRYFLCIRRGNTCTNSTCSPACSACCGLQYPTLKVNIACRITKILLISLFSIFFISAISLTDNFTAFCLHAVPSAMMIRL